MDIYQALKNDHDEIKDLLNELCSLGDEDEKRFELVDQIKALLIPHARAEEALFYNTLGAIGAGKNLAIHGYGEHMAAETLLRSLQGMEKLNIGWKKTAEKLRDALVDHIREEETEIFEQARSALSLQEAEGIGKAFQSLKPKIQEQGSVKNTVDMVINMMPPRFADKVRNMGNEPTDSAQP